MATLQVRILCFLVLILPAWSFARIEQPSVTDEYLDVLTTYAVYAKSIWHKASPGGYWGDGIDAKNQNGAVRGTCNTLLTYSMLAYAIRHPHWLPATDEAILKNAGLDTDRLMQYIRWNLEYLAAHHQSAASPLKPVWGFHWQSSLWLGSLGPAAILQWDFLQPQLRDEITSMAAAEADRIAATPPKNRLPHDTGAEENGWNTAAPALALSLAPHDARASSWWRAVRTYAANVYSTPGDMSRTTSTGADPVSAFVSTSNLFNDFTLDNHGFFHPDYVQVSGQHLGEAWIILRLGDERNDTSFARQFVPFAQFHLRDVWQRVLKPLLLPSGEFAFPSGNDWTFHCSTNQSYFAYIATALHDPVAAAAERRALQFVQYRNEISPPGRLLGDSNLEWWWEPLVAKRCCTALLHHYLNPGELPEDGKALDELDTESLFPDSRVWTRRTPDYFISASFGSRRMGYFVPFANSWEKESFITIPADDGILPDDITSGTVFRDGETRGIRLVRRNGGRCYLVALPHSVLILSPGGLRGLAVENDSLTSPGRTISWPHGSQFVPSLKPTSSFKTPGNWATVDSSMALFSPGGWKYLPAGKWNRKSVAVDRIIPSGDASIMWLVPNVSPAQAGLLATDWNATSSSGTITIKLRDGTAGSRYQVKATVNAQQVAEFSQMIISN